MEKITYCKKCFANSLRPRISFTGGVCSACVWAEEKKTINWELRFNQLKEICNQHRRNDYFDCIVPVSGGKDSSYVAYKMKNELHMHPLCVTINPDLQLEINQKNLQNFSKQGYDLLAITPNIEVSKKLNKKGFIEQGRPMIGWMLAVQAAVMRVAVMYHIPLVMFGEDGETEYGGRTALKNNPLYSVEDAVKIYLSGNSADAFMDEYEDNKASYQWYQFPSKEQLEELDIKLAHWSYFENWDANEHEKLAKEKFDLLGQKERAIGTYTKYCQNDTKLYVLHTYLMFLKFGFGRCNQDVSMDIRSGKMTLNEGAELIKKYDGEYPSEYIQDYLEYFEMTKDEFESVLDKHANKNILEKSSGYWKLISSS